MTRWLAIVVVAATFGASGCNNPTCGAGTKQVQGKNGDVQCVPVARMAGIFRAGEYDECMGVQVFGAVERCALRIHAIEPSAMARVLKGVDQRVE